MNGTVYKVLSSTTERACAVACTADGPHCAAFAMPLGPGAKLCHLLTAPLIEWFGGATGHPCRCAVKVAAGAHWEGAGENDLIQLKDGSLLTVFRVNSCAPYWHSRSSDDGATWTKATPLAANVNGSARPKLLRLPNGQPLLSGGRPGLFLWLGDATGTTWTPLNVAAIHNSLTVDEPAWQYHEGFANGSAVGSPCEERTPTLPAGSTSCALIDSDPRASDVKVWLVCFACLFKSPSQHANIMIPSCFLCAPTDTSLLEVGKGEYILQYDRLANGWDFPPGIWGTRDFTFSMRFTWLPGAGGQ
jgi:hypothetical protein